MTVDALLSDWRAADARALYWERELRILLEEQPDGSGPDIVHVARVLRMRRDEQEALERVVGVINRYLPRGWDLPLHALHHREFEPTEPLHEGA